MEITQVRFVLDSFMHYVPEDKVVDFVKGIVGKKVLLVPDDNNEADINCIEGFYMGEACCHVSGRKSMMVRELMKQMNRRSLMVEVQGHNLEKGYKTVFCVVEPEVPFTDDFLTEHLRLYQEWKYAGKANVTSSKHRLLMANTDYLLDRLAAEDATEDELMPVVERYLEVLPMAFSREDKENCIRVNLMLQNSPLEPIRAYSRRLVEILDYLNHSEQRMLQVREWIDELKASKVCQREAAKLTREELKGRTDNLNDFPENLYESYETDFPLFCGNLYYNQIPCWEQQQFLNGIAVCELAQERWKATRDEMTFALPAFVVDRDMAQDIILLIAHYQEGKVTTKDKVMPVRAAIEAGVIRRPTFAEYDEVEPFASINKSSFSDYTSGKIPFEGEAYDEMLSAFRELKKREGG